MIADLLTSVEPGAVRGTLVSIRDLRRESARRGLSWSDVEAEVLSGARDFTLSLHRHDFPSSLSDQERADLLRLPDGTYVVGVAIRQG